MAFRRAAFPSALRASDGGPLTLRAAIATVLAFTFLNPQVYLDTVVLLGGLSARYDCAGRLACGAGACIASFTWFFSLGYGVRLLSPLFAQPSSWWVLDTVIGVIIWALAGPPAWELL